MKQVGIIAGLMLMLACSEQQINPEPQSIIRDNLPIADRDLLLSPLETSMDDLAEITLEDPNLVILHDQLEKGQNQLSVNIYLSGPDTQAIVAELSSSQNSKERHEHFYNRQHKVFKSIHRFINAAAIEPESKFREFKFYFEDSGAQLSAYSKVNFNDTKAPDVWTPVCLTREEESFLAHRVRSLQNSFKTEQ